MVGVTSNLGGRKDLNVFLGKRVFQTWVSANLVVFNMFALKTELNLEYNEHFYMASHFLLYCI